MICHWQLKWCNQNGKTGALYSHSTKTSQGYGFLFVDLVKAAVRKHCVPYSYLLDRAGVYKIISDFNGNLTTGFLETARQKMLPKEIYLFNDQCIEKYFKTDDGSRRVYNVYLALYTEQEKHHTTVWEIIEKPT